MSCRIKNIFLGKPDFVKTHLIGLWKNVYQLGLVVHIKEKGVFFIDFKDSTISRA
jgi:hypothetical protein